MKMKDPTDVSLDQTREAGAYATEADTKRRSEELRAELLPVAEAEFRKHEALQEQLADIATLVGESKRLSVPRYDENAPWKYDHDDEEYLQTPVFIDEGASGEKTSVGYYINSWVGSDYTELRVVVNDKDISAENRIFDEDFVLVSIGGNTTQEFTNEAGESAYFAGTVFEAPTKPIDRTTPFKERDDKRVMVGSDNPAFAEVQELVHRMSAHYRQVF